MTSRSLLIINYRSAVFAVDAIRTARASSSEPLQVVVVDNSMDASELVVLRPVVDALIEAPRNLGYAGGINVGRRACSGDVLIVSNPDVRFGSDAVDRLAEVDATVAGPALFWDDGHQWLLPPAELHTAGEVASRALATRSHAWARARDQRRVRARIAFWSRSRPAPIDALSGAVMAIKARAFDEAGGFDERFPLYFEENDFLRRVGGRVVYVPAARCRHLYNQSAGRSTEAAGLYAESERRYLQKWGGSRWKRWERKLRSSVAPEPRDGTAPREPHRDLSSVVIEASPLASFETAAGHFPAAHRAEVPDDVWLAYRSDVLYFRTVSRRTGEVLDSWSKARIPS